MKINIVTIWNVYILLSAEKFAAEFAEIKIKFIINFYSEYDQIILHSESQDMTEFQTLLRLLQMMTLLQDTTNSINQFC